MAREEKYRELAEKLVGLLGGRENISYFTHCVTRLRVNVSDKELVRDEEIRGLKGVLGTQWSGEQYQVIIGQDVDDAYQLVCAQNGLGEKAKQEQDEAETKKKIGIAAVLDGIAGCVSPVVIALIGGGMIKVVLLLLVQLGLLTEKAGTYVTLSFVADAPFYFLPVLVGAAAAKKFGANIYLGMTLGAALLSPTFVDLVNATGSGGSIFGLPISGQSYSSNVFAMILTMWVAAKLEKWIAKHSPAFLRSVLEPLGTLFIMTPIMLVVLAPLGAIIGTYLAAGIKALYDATGFLGLAVLTGVVPIFVLTGMHMAFPAIAVQNFSSLGYDPLICIASMIPNFNQGAACLAVALKTKDKDLKTESTTAAVATIVAGVSEPALFGVTLKYRTPLYAVMAGSAIGGAIAGIFQCCSYAFPGSFALFGFITMLGDKGWSNIVYMIIAVLVGMAVTFVLTMFLYKPEEVKNYAE